MKKQCEECEYLRYCFWGLKFFRMYMSNAPCKQGRKVKVMKVKDATPRSDNKVASV